MDDWRFNRISKVAGDTSTSVKGHHNLWNTVAINEGLELDGARLKEDPRHSSSLNALMEGCRLVIDSRDFYICYLF